MNRSFRAAEKEMPVPEKQRQQQMMGSFRRSVVKEKEDELGLFLEMRKRDERDQLLFEDEFDSSLGSVEGSSHMFSMPTAIPARKTGADEFLNSENDKNDYEWLLTPPGTPLFPSLEMESQKTVVAQAGSPKARPTAIRSRLSNNHPEATGRNNLVSRQQVSSPGLNTSSSGLRRPSSSGGPASRPATPTGRPATPTGRPATSSGRPATSTGRPSTSTGRPALGSSTRSISNSTKTISNTSRPTSTATSRLTSTPSSRLTSTATSRLTSTPTSRPTSTLASRLTSTPTSRPTRSSTPTSRPTMGSSSTKPTLPARSSTPTPRSTARSSTPTSRPSLPVTRPASRAATPTRRQPTLTTSTKTSTPTVTKPVANTTRSGGAPPPPRSSSPSVRPKPWKPHEMPGYSLDAPPNLRTSVSDRPPSVTRGRPGAPSSRSSSVEPVANGRVRRQSCSPSRGRLPNGMIHSSGSSVPVPALNRAYAKANDNLNPGLYGTKMVERVINMRKLVPPKQDNKHSPHSNLSAKSSPDSSGFGRSLSKKSLDMAMRHMDIRRTIPGNLRPLMNNIPASSMYSVRTGPARSRTVSVSDSPLATSSNASSEMSVNNNGLCLDGNVDDEINSERRVLNVRGR
ncbi:hypothetical protein HanRHA438_Chr12g0554281 [Helianthus annuus]|uniref:Putative proline-rich family protein n=1 Tax=Helianthus annuus TaxID=4232 RepID=A0A251T3C3_HELAN|nr:mucin-1 [Helianthus annuus]KAF5778077.1 hypothetical protein HanXRQr2_Chr12g0543261 [Helianthus annuus]KAJ0489508.1 hypothetical protein HanHA300_Chr12g0444891 [Helianthus annuus]KAJ0493370.1 hypothetical protein HanIR_Chr12g0585391 [Helianthus annuus]KAJ0505412.1 hypothetical protein HanHA89_Chr12g0470271 [Helianthus annuus]KAJ0675095.1 hypothetical protein HanLR1_Chr12g0447331 [Helianthus annuus]